MISMKNLYKGGRDALAILSFILIVCYGFMFVASNRAGQTERADYRANIERIESKQSEYDELSRSSLEAVSRIEKRIETIQGSLDRIEKGQRLIGDESIRTGVLGDRNDRLLSELKQRLAD